MTEIYADQDRRRNSPLRAIRTLERVMLSFVRSRFEEDDLSFVQWIALELIQEGSASTPSDLSRELKFSSGATTRLVDGLERRTLLLRTRSALDRRTVTLTITANGTREAARLEILVDRAWHDILARLPQSDVAQFLAQAAKLTRAIEGLHRDATGKCPGRANHETAATPAF